MNVLALIEQPGNVCCRYRIDAYAPELTKRGHRLQAISLREGGRLRFLLYHAVADADLVILQRKLLPSWQLSLVRRLAKSLIYDFDDAVFQRDSFQAKGPQSLRRQRRFLATIRAADTVIAGNAYLGRQARRIADAGRVRVVPTTVQTAAYRPANHVRTGAGVRLVWIGSSSTLQGLELAARHLQAAGEKTAGLDLQDAPFQGGAPSVTAVVSGEVPLAIVSLSAAVAQADAEQVLEAGYGSLAAAVGALETQAARAVAAQRTGDVTGARAALVELRSAYHAVLAPLMRSVDVEVAAGAEDLLATVTERADLSSHDVSLVAAQVGAVRRALLGGAAPAAQAFELSVDSFWSNLTRPLVMILLGVLAIVPLVLLNLAFGGSNRNWRLVGWSLFLLLVPVFYESLAAVGALLSSVVDQPWLTALAGWSMFTSTAGQVAWALLVLVALVLAIVGFYGICVQFGLIGGGRRRDAVAATGAAEVHRPTGNTTLDWDEEF